MEGEQNNVNANTESSNSIGPILGIIVILAIIILGGLYFWNERDAMPTPTADEQSTESIQEQSDADDTASIEADLEATDVENVDAELDAE